MHLKKVILNYNYFCNITLLIKNNMSLGEHNTNICVYVAILMECLINSADVCACV